MSMAAITSAGVGIMEPPDPYLQAMRALPDLREVCKQIQKESPGVYEPVECDHLMLTLKRAGGEETPLSLYVAHHLGQTIPLSEIRHQGTPQVPYYGTTVIFSEKAYQGPGTFEENFVPELERIAQEESPVVNLTALTGQMFLHTKEPLRIINKLPDLLKRFSGEEV